MRFSTLRRSARFILLSTCAALALAGTAFAADPGKLTISVDKPGVKISPMLYGLMTEEINHSYDGGLYAELIQNRTFQDHPKDPAHWIMSFNGGGEGKISLDNADPLSPALPTSLRLDFNLGPRQGFSGPPNEIGIANEGYWGIPVQPNTTYIASFFAKATAGMNQPLTVTLQSNNFLAASSTVPALTDSWKKYTVVLKTTPNIEPSTAGRFTISTQGPSKGSFWLNLVSLTPPTFNNRPNGLRPDLMKWMADMQPAFLRLPGGNYLEGNTIAERFNWKQTFGPLENRPGHQCPWGYRSSDGMGLLEFLTWCEDLKMEPVLAVFAGYALRGEVVTGDALKPFVQDALDEIEYVTGDASIKWGAQRIKDGHPTPFKLTYVEVGNEDGFDASHAYDARFTPFFDAIKAKYPKLQIIATAPVTSRKPDVMDDHYYRSAAAMQNDVHHYDKTDRNGPKIFVGEWATTEGSPTPTMNAALGDAAWLTGMERNADLIVMSCYAPLLVNVNPGASQWGTNLIGFDALKSFGSPSYYVQKMFNLNRGDVVLPVDLIPQTAKTIAEVPAPHGGIGAATWATNAEYKDLKVTKPDGTLLFTSDFSKDTTGWKFANGDWKADEGTLHQTGTATESRAFTGDPAWADVNYTLKAKKLSGNEGFMVMFNVKDANNYMWFNVGGWTNTRTALELAENGARRTIGNDSNFTVEANRWYDVRIEVRGKTSTCFIDGKQICAATFTPLPEPDPMYATASRDQTTGDVIVKVVNILPTSQQMELNLLGAPTIANSATIDIVAGDPTWVNTLAEPEKVATKRSTITNAAPKFTYEFPAHSVSVLRLKTK